MIRNQSKIICLFALLVVLVHTDAKANHTLPRNIPADNLLQNELDETSDLYCMESTYASGYVREDGNLYTVSNIWLNVGANDLTGWAERGFVTIDLSEMPIGATIEEVSLSFFVSLTSFDLDHETMISSLDELPAEANGQDVWESMSTDFLDNVSNACEVIGDHTLDLNEDAITSIQAALDEGQGWWGMGIKDQTDSHAFAQVQGHDGVNPPFITVTYGIGGPLPPSDAELVSLNEEELVLTWTDNSDDEDGFNLEKRHRDEADDPWDDWVEIGEVDTDVVDWTEETILAGIHQYRINSFSEEGILDWVESNEVVHLMTPNAPSSLDIYNDGTEIIVADWIDNSQVETGFTVEVRYSLDGMNWGAYSIVNTEIPSNTQTISFAGIYNNYVQCRLRADQNLFSSAWVESQALVMPHEWGAPTIFVAVFNAENQTIGLSWQDNSDEEEGFEIHSRQSENGVEWSTWDFLDHVDENAIAFFDQGVSSNMIYQYRIRTYVDTDYSIWVETEVNTLGATDQQQKDLPSETKITQAYPNPFNGTTALVFELGQMGLVELRIFNVHGRLVEDLLSADFNAGSHRLALNLDHLSTGTYFLRLNSQGSTSVKKLVLIK